MFVTQSGILASVSAWYSPYSITNSSLLFHWNLHISLLFPFFFLHITGRQFCLVSFWSLFRSRIGCFGTEATVPDPAEEIRQGNDPEVALEVGVEHHADATEAQGEGPGDEGLPPSHLQLSVLVFFFPSFCSHASQDFSE